MNKYNQHLGVSNLEIDGAPIDGRSGGGLFDEQGRLIGVCNAADYKNDVGIYAGPGSVHWQLDRASLAHLYQRPQGPAADQPDEQIASVQPSSPIVPVAATEVGLSSPGDHQEVIVIVRNAGDPATSRVMTLRQPSADLMQMIERQSR